jgi:selenocysteine-specific elongation factor
VRLPREAVVAVAGELIREGAMVREGMGVRLASHRPRLDPADAALWNRIAPLLEAQLLRPPGVHEIATAIHVDARKTESLLVRAARYGLCVRVSKTRFYRPAALRALADVAAELAGARPDRLVTAAAFRDRSGIGRNVTIEILEFFDKAKFTRRKGDAHELLRSPAEAFGDKAGPDAL